jgi:phage terminase small subunit
MALTPKQDCFCREYVKAKFNGTVAYRAAYPACKSDTAARVNSARMLANASIQKRIAEIAQSAREEEITPERVLRELGFIAFQRANHLFHPDDTPKAPSEWDEATSATIASVDTEEKVTGDDERSVTTRKRRVRRYNKTRALEIFVRYFGLMNVDARRPERPTIDLSQFSDAQKQTLIVALGLVLGEPLLGGIAEKPTLPKTRT